MLVLLVKVLHAIFNYLTTYSYMPNFHALSSLVIKSMIFWESVGHQKKGFKVTALTYDRLSANQRLFRLHHLTAQPDKNCSNRKR